MLKSITVSPYNKNSDMGQKSRFLINDLSSYDGIFNTNCSIYGQDQIYGEFEESSIDNPDCCIQYVNFENFIRTEYNNIGIFEPSFQDVSQQENYLKLLDTIVVRSDAQKNILPSSVKERVSVVRPSIGNVPRQSPMKRIGSKLSFYISAIADHSNLDIALSAYLREFTINDNVVLNVLSSSPEDLVKFIENIRKKLSMYAKIELYPEISIYDNASIHEKSDCFIDIRMTYDISLQTMVATANSNPIISCNHNGLLQWVGEDSCYLVESCEGYRDSHSIGNVPDGLSLAREMRRAYEDRDGFKEKQAMMLDSGYKSFYYTTKESIGETICSLY